MMLSIFRAIESPHIYMFPRSKDTLFHVNTTTGALCYRNSLESYGDTTAETLPIMETNGLNGARKLKEIDSKVYIDLWNNKDRTEGGGRVNIIETARKITIGFLKKENNVYKSYQYLVNKPAFNELLGQVQLVLTVDLKDTRSYAYIDGSASGYHFTSKESLSECAYIPISNLSPDLMVECTLHIKSSQTDINREGDIEVCAYLIRKGMFGDDKIGNESRLALHLCRCPQAGSEDDPFSVLKEQGKSKDLFVMPRLYQNDERHKTYIKKLQLYSNQVLARHNGLPEKPAEETDQDWFDFVKEDGIYTEQLGINYGMAVDVFKHTKVPNSLSTGGLYANIVYDLSTFGQAEGFTQFMASNYDIDEKNVKGLVVDKNFIYGQKEQQNTLSDVQGLKNLYEKVVLAFRERFIAEANRYVEFGNGNPNARWLSRPRFNPNYHRGDLTVTESMEIKVYDSDSEISGIPIALDKEDGTCLLEADVQLPVGTLIKFPPNVPDKFDYDETGTHRYQVSGITLPNQNEVSAPENMTWFIPLKYVDKKECDDRTETNFCNYVGNLDGVAGLNPDDREALENYAQYYGIPYYKSPSAIPAYEPDFIKNYGWKKREFASLAEDLTQEVLNWYSYLPKTKPNAPRIHAADAETKDILGVGTDCSGLVLNCLLDCHIENEQNGGFFFSAADTFEETANTIGSTRTRKIPLDVFTGDNSLVQDSDLLYDGGHIAISAIEPNTYIQRDQITAGRPGYRYFTIINNYGNNGIFIDNSLPFEEGYFKRTLRGPFRHWGAVLDNNAVKAGRVFLWYGQ